MFSMLSRNDDSKRKMRIASFDYSIWRLRVYAHKTNDFWYNFHAFLFKIKIMGLGL